MVIEGDPTKAGPYVLRYKVPAREMSTPHFHPEDRFITVIQGTWWTGTGETFDPDSHDSALSRQLHETSGGRRAF
jgi:hypothetical protein